MVILLKYRLIADCKADKLPSTQHSSVFQTMHVYIHVCLVVCVCKTKCQGGRGEILKITDYGWVPISKQNYEDS